MIRKAAATLLMITIMSVITLALLEGIVAWSFWQPRMMLLPQSLSRYLYVRFARNTIQMMPECAVYDASLTYTLKPGRCTFANREFSNTVDVNRIGVRDDDASLQAPDTVMVGDSLTMGWGVEEHEAFPSRYEQQTSRRTLNAGVSSYGTARELMMLERIDRSGMRDLVIQHSDNDAGENEAFLQNHGLRILSRQEYERTVEQNRGELSYFPGKYAINVLVQFRSALGGAAASRSAASAASPVLRQAELFVGVLERSPIDISGVRVTVLSLDPQFIAAAKSRAAQSTIGWVTRVRFLELDDMASIPGAYYTLDDHPTAAGHARIAQALVAALTPR